MGIRSFFHKIKTGFVRMSETSIPYVSSTKRYGNYGEDEFVEEIERHFPESKVKRNVVINTDDGNAEIDCLILYRNKLYAVEVKSWKGRLYETEQGFLQEKTDRWTGEIHNKYQKSPFKQLNRAIYLLKTQIPSKVWINGIVYFEDDDFEGVRTLSEKNMWYDNIRDLMNYIKTDGKESIAINAVRFFDKCVTADCLYAKSGDKSLHCLIDNDSLRFQTEIGLIAKDKISYIQIEHHWYYDKLNIVLKDGRSCWLKKEHGKIMVDNNGHMEDYAFCKLDYIELGE